MTGDSAHQPLARLWTANYTKAWVANFLVFFACMVMQPLFPVYLSTEFGADKDTIGMVLAGYSVLAVLARPVSGYLVDSFPRVTVLHISFVLFFIGMGGYLLAGSLLLFALVRTLHGIPFGACTVVTNTVAVDSLPYSRRAEGIGYYGLSNNLAMAIAPSVGVAIYGWWADFEWLLWLGFAVAFAAVVLTSTVRLPRRKRPLERKRLTLNGFFYLRGWSPAIAVACSAFAYGVMSTFVAIYGLEKLGITQGVGLFFLLFAVGLISSRIVGGRSLRQGRIIRNGIVGMGFCSAGYIVFAAVPHELGFYGSALLCGMGNGHMFPAVQNMFMGMCSRDERGVASSTTLVAWDIGLSIGTLMGGIVVVGAGYTAAFGMGALVNFLGALFFVFHSCPDYLRKRL